MKEKEMIESSLMTFFLVTGFSFLAFTMFLGVIGDVNSKFFMRTGFIAVGLGILTGAYILITVKTEQVKTN